MERRIKGKVKGKAIIGIAVAAIMLASVMAVLPSAATTGVVITYPDDVSEKQVVKALIDPIVLPIEPISIELRQLTLAGTMLKIAAVEGWTVEKVLLGEAMMDIGAEHVYPLGEHEIKVVFKQGEKTVERLMKVRIFDKTKPAIKVVKEIISKDEAMFSISVGDNCDAAPAVSAVMMLDKETLKGLEIEQKEAKAVMLMIDLNKNKAVLKGPEKIREAMKAMLEQGMMGMMEEKMLRTQEMVIMVEREEVTEDVKTYYNYKYNYKGRKLTIKGSGEANLEMMMDVKAMDASGNVAEQPVCLALLGMK